MTPLPDPPGGVLPFGIRRDGQRVHAIGIGNVELSATVLTHGAVLQRVHLAGVPHSLTLGASDIAAYEGDMTYFGALIGPVANRIAGASAVIGGRTHSFEANQGTDTLHSGTAGIENALWSVVEHAADRVTLTLFMGDGEGGFPGNRRITATYAIDGRELRLDITATTDAPTLMNVAHHGYWNLDGTDTWAGHSLRIAADAILPTTDAKVPTGEITALSGHPHDFRHTRQIAPDDVPHLDHNFCLSRERRELTEVLSLTGQGGVRMDVASTEPGVQVFDGAPIDTGALPTVHGRRYGPHCGFAIEPQSWPDAPHHAHFPSILLNSGETYHQTTTFRFTPSGPAALH